MAAGGLLTCFVRAWAREGGMDMCILRMVGLGRRVRSCRSEQISKTVGE